MSRGVDILVATPGRLLDLMEQGLVKLDRLEVFVLDEADRMLDMGFIHDVRRIVKTLPAKRQTLLFSATMPPEIAKLADKILTEPVRVEVTPVSTTAERIEQHVYVRREGGQASAAGRSPEAPRDRPRAGLHPHQARRRPGRRAARPDRGSGPRRSTATSPRTPASGRWRTSRPARSGCWSRPTSPRAASTSTTSPTSSTTTCPTCRKPTSTASAARRGRATSGIAISFCDSEERAFLKDIEKLIKVRIPVVEDHPWHSHGGVVSAPEVSDRPPRPPPAAAPAPARRRGRAPPAAGPSPQHGRPQRSGHGHSGSGNSGQGRHRPEGR